jgi:hypothetical protein
MMRIARLSARRACALAGSALIALGLGACLDNKLANEPGAQRAVYIAQQRDFAAYGDWMSFADDVQNEHGGVVGTTTVYLNEMPPAGAATFPVGTIVVKTMKLADSPDLNIHAMVKRGSGFNPKGTLDWEFFELALAKTGVPFILWRGEKPPTGEKYQLLLSKANLALMDAETDCNGCHASAKDGTFDSLADLLQ